MMYDHGVIREYNKLIRGKVPELIRRDGQFPITRVLDRDTRRSALLNKLRDEVNNLGTADERNQILDEAADVYELLLTIISEAGYVDRDLYSHARKKRLERGSFDAGIWLERIESE